MKNKAIFLKSNLNLLIILPLFLIKSARFLFEPRLWAEEGTVYLNSSLHDGFWSIFKLHQGYYSIIPNFTLYFASLGDYQNFPFYTAFVSFFFWCLLLFLINKINSKELKENYSFKFFLGISVFFILNFFQEIFLNTINLQFITPLILGVLLLYDFEKLSKWDLFFSYFIIAICIFNGVLFFPFIPLLLYKMYISKKYKTAIIFLILSVLSLSLPIFAGSNGESLSLSGRIINNFEFKWKVLTANNLKLKILTNWYLFLIPLSLFAFYSKRYYAAYYAFAALLLCFFIDFTKLTIAFDWRYLSVNYALICLAIFFFIQKNKVLQSIFTIVIVFWFGRTFFHHDMSYSNDISKWSIEYKNLNQGKPAKIHPKNWQIEIEN